MYGQSSPLPSTPPLTIAHAGDNPKVLNGTADAHIATFFVPAAVKEENDGAKDHDDEDGEEDVKPVKGKRAAAPKKEKAEKGPKQAKLAFKTE